MHSGQHQLDALTTMTQMALMGAVTQHADDRPDYDDFLNALLLILLFAHAQAAMIGRQHAGDMTPMTAGDQAFAEGVMLEEMPFLLGFVEDLKGGRYSRGKVSESAPAADDSRKPTRAVENVATGDSGGARPSGDSAVPEEFVAGQDTAAIVKRAILYAGRLTGTANEAWVAALPVGTLIDWVLGRTENHCGMCPELAANSPWTTETLPTKPGMNQTPCLFFCDCELRASDGGMGFVRKSEAV